jgi:uncharacterized protein (TIGR02246 family)
MQLTSFARLAAYAAITFIAAAAPCHAAAPQTDIEKAVLAVNTAMITAANRLDVDGLFDHIVDSSQSVIVQNGVIFRSRAEAYAAVKRGMEGVTKLERRIENPQVTVISPDTALLVGDGSMTATFEGGATMSTRFAVSLVFVQRDGRWKVLHGHYSMIPPPMR